MALGMPMGGGVGSGWKGLAINQDKGAARRGIAERQYGGGQTSGLLNQQQQTFDAYKGFYAPGLQAAAGQRDRARATLPFMSDYYDSQRGYQQREHDLGMSGIGLQQEGLGIDRVANQRDAAYYQNLLNVLNQQRDIVGMNFTNQRQQLQDTAATNVRGTNQASTAAGNWLGPERMAQVSDIFKNYDTSLQDAELARRSGILGLNKEEFGLEKSKAETGDRAAKLDIMAKQYGLDAGKLNLALEQGLGNLGYQQYMNAGDLLDKIDSSNAQEAAVARQILDAVWQSGKAFSSGAMGDYYRSFGIGGR